MPDTPLSDPSVQEEIRQDAATTPLDEDTAREGLELDLMEHEASDDGEHIGEQLS